MVLDCGCMVLERIADGASEVIGVTRGIGGGCSVENTFCGML